MICPFFDFPTYFFFTSDVPPLLYYSHIPTIIISLFVGIFVFLSGKKFLLNQLLLGVSVFFSLWVIIDLITWTNINSESILFVWSLLSLCLSIVAILSIYFIYVFLEKKDVSSGIKFVFLLLLAPVFLLSTTSFNLAGFDLIECDAFTFENIKFYTYYYSLGLLAMIWIFMLLVKHYRVATIIIRKEIILIGIGIESFLFLFFGLSYIGSYLTTVGVLEDSRLEMYGLFGMTFFISLIAYLIIKFKAFDIKLIGAQALVWALVIVIGSEFFFVQSIINQVLVGVTLVISSTLGLILVRSVKKEIAQKEHIEKIAKELKRLNDDKSEFVSFASHQIRTPLTSIKGYSAEILEGDYGELTPELKDAVQKILVRGTDAVTLISQYLDKSKMELGQLKYDFVDFDIVELAKSVTKGFEPNAEQSKLTLKFSTDETAPCLVNADKGKVKEVIGNLIDNAIKYTPSGSIEVSVFKKDDKVLVKFSDTGVGMSKEVIADLYKKFGRAKDAAKTNILGTGLGLFLAKTFMEAMKGRSWAESEGDGKGSQFYVELPIKS